MNILSVRHHLPSIILVIHIAVVCLWRSKTGVVKLDQTLKRIICITVQSAMLPCTCMAVAVALYHASPVSLLLSVYQLSVAYGFIAYEGPSHTILCFIDGKALFDWHAIHIELKSSASRTNEVE